MGGGRSGNSRVGVDTGGTFTDLVRIDGRGRISIIKIPSTPEDPAEAVLLGLARLGRKDPDVPVIHGTTVGTNAFLQRRGGRTALVTTAGFEDVLVLGRQARPQLYRLDPAPRVSWIPDRLRIGLPERRGPRGEILLPLRRQALERLRRRLRRERVEAVAVCLLHAYAHPGHEQAVARALMREGWHLSLSHRIANEFREYERTCTTVANAVLAKPLRGYLERLARRLGSRRFQIMTSSGGWISARRAAAEPIRTVLSGPAGGALGAALLGRAAGSPRLITLDMGGTSTDMALMDGDIPRVRQADLDGVPLRIPCLDIRSVGAGGGSIARVDSGGALRVGPESAGADPGPVAYGRGGKQPTLTDAHLVLGRLPPEGLLGGQMPLDRERARQALADLGRRLGLTAEEAALGILRVTEATLERAVRAISAGRGKHPGRYTLLVYGGAGGLHACSLASALGIRRILVPPDPGAFSALGLCCSAAVSETARTLLRRGRRFPASRIEPWLAPLEREARCRLLREGHAPAGLRIEREADLRYAGQSHELTLPVVSHMERAFHRAHLSAFGYKRPGDELELVTLRVRITAHAPRLVLRKRPGHRAPARSHSRVETVVASGERRKIPRYRRQDLRPGHHLRGPALVTEFSATTYVAPKFRLHVDAFGNLVLEPAPRSRQ